MSNPTAYFINTETMLPDIPHSVGVTIRNPPAGARMWRHGRRSRDPGYRCLFVVPRYLSVLLRDAHWHARGYREVQGRCEHAPGRGPPHARVLLMDCVPVRAWTLWGSRGFSTQRRTRTRSRPPTLIGNTREYPFDSSIAC